MIEKSLYLSVIQKVKQETMKKSLLLVIWLLSACLLQAKVKGAKHVVLIGLDAWGGYSMPRADMPAVKRMMEEGAWTLESRCVLPSSSACNWASAIMGSGIELHGYTEWGSKTPEIPSRVVNRYGKYPTVFSLLREQRPGLELGCIYEWDGIGYLFEREAVDYIHHVAEYKEKPHLTAEKAVKYIREKRPNFTWIVFDEPDVTGHKDGHDTPAYYAKLTELDGYIARIVEATREAGIYDNTIFILMADHGGIDKGHGKKSLEELQVPFVVFGKGVKKGHRIENSMMIFDVGATVAWIFGVKQPQVWTGRPVTEAFR